MREDEESMDLQDFQYYQCQCHRQCHPSRPLKPVVYRSHKRSFSTAPRRVCTESRREDQSTVVFGFFANRVSFTSATSRRLQWLRSLTSGHLRLGLSVFESTFAQRSMTLAKDETSMMNEINWTFSTAVGICPTPSTVHRMVIHLPS